MMMIVFNVIIMSFLPYYTILGFLQATDADLGVFGEIKYELYGSGISKYVIRYNDTWNLELILPNS